MHTEHERIARIEQSKLGIGVNISVLSRKCRNSLRLRPTKNTLGCDIDRSFRLITANKTQKCMFT